MYLRWIKNGALPHTPPKGHCPFGIPFFENAGRYVLFYYTLI